MNINYFARFNVLKQFEKTIFYLFCVVFQAKKNV